MRVKFHEGFEQRDPDTTDGPEEVIKLPKESPDKEVEQKVQKVVEAGIGSGIGNVLKEMIKESEVGDFIDSMTNTDEYIQRKVEEAKMVENETDKALDNVPRLNVNTRGKRGNTSSGRINHGRLRG